MMDMKVYSVTADSPEELIAKLKEAMEADDDRRLLGLEREPRGRKTSTGATEYGAPRRRARRAEDALLTVRRDLMSLRQDVLDGSGTRREILRGLDYTVDQLDNLLAEM